MKRFFAFTLTLACIFLLTGCWTATMVDTPPDLEDPADHADPWGITLSAEDVTASGLTLVCTQSGGDPTGDLQTGTPFWIERYTDDGWVPVPYADPETEIAWTMQAFLIPQNERTEWTVSWSWLYGKLDPGTYRIGKTITDFRGPGDYDDRVCYAEFAVPAA